MNLVEGAEPANTLPVKLFGEQARVKMIMMYKKVFLVHSKSELYLRHDKFFETTYKSFVEA